MFFISGEYVVSLKLNKIIKCRLIRNQRGVTLIEAVIGIALLSIVAVGVLAGVATAFKASATNDKISTALSLAQSQLEFIHTQDYECADGTGVVTTYLIISDIPTNYSISVSAVSINPDTGAEYEIPDAGLQKITVVVSQLNNPNPVTLIGYKVKTTSTACP